MSPLPATLPMLAQSQSPPQTLVTTETAVTTNSSEMTTSATMTVQNEINSSSVPLVCASSSNSDNNRNCNRNDTSTNQNNTNNMENSDSDTATKSNDGTSTVTSAAVPSPISVTKIPAPIKEDMSDSRVNVNSDVELSSKITAVGDAKPSSDSTNIAGTGTKKCSDNNNTESSNINSENCLKITDYNSNTKNDKCDGSSKQNKNENKEDNSNSDKEMNPPSKDDDEINTDEVLDKPRKILLKNINDHIICNLCKGYLIDATTIVECLHSFCHSCLMTHLRTEKYCPRCEMMINTAKPNIKPDTTLQAIVYKLVPGLYEKELMRKRAFYRDRPEEARLATPEQRGDDTEYLIFGPTENMSLSLEYADIEELPGGSDWNDLKRPKYLQCPAIFTVAHLKKFILLKFGINSNLFSVEIMYKVKTIVLSNHYTLMDVAYIYTWKRDAPMRFFFRIKEVDGFTEKLKACRQLMRTKEIKIEKKEENNNNNNTDTIIPKNDSIRKNNSKNNDKSIVRNDNCRKRIEDNEQIMHHKNNKSSSQQKSDKDNSTTRETPLLSVKLIDFKKEGEIAAGNGGAEVEKIKTEIEIKEEPVEANATESNTKVIALNAKNDSNTEINNKPEKLKMTFLTKNKQTKIASSNEDSSKSESVTRSLHRNNKITKQQQQQQQTAHAATASGIQKSPEHEERKVENIKLKIDLSKQSSVTIINMSGPENTRKEIVKPIKQEKEWKLKAKKDKESNSPKSSPKGEDKYTIKPSEDQRISPDNNNKKLLVPPITIKAERISPSSKEGSTMQLKIKHNESKSPSNSANTDTTTDKEDDDEEKKSKFLNSFALTPIKSTNSPDKNNDKKLTSLEKSAIPQISQLPESTISNKTANVSKRKSKEPIKTLTKKPKFESSKATADEIKAAKPNEKTPTKDAQTISFKLAPFPIDSSPTDLVKKQEDEKLMPAPPPLKMIDVFKKNGIKQAKQPRSSKWAVGNKTKVTAQSSHLPAPPGSLTPRPMIPAGIASSKLSITTAAPPGNRTPIARRYPPILPKSPRPNPFANLPTEVNKLLQNNGTEIKQIPSGNGQELKVYGPAMPVKSNNNNNNNQKSSNSPVPPSSISPARNTIKSQSTNYLNYALMNASKTKVDVMPLGCRTPIYTPNSPIYSPNSPQYMPNYNIPTQPTYKYTKSQSNANNYLQNVLGQNKQLSGLFPGPPIKKPPESVAGNNKTPPPQISVTNDENNAKRPYPFSKSPPSVTEKSLEPPEKQAKVQSLLNSCNINIPSSLSITITNEDSESGTVSGSNLKHKSPVNNYIEILKLPDNQPIITNDQSISDHKLKSNQSELKNDISMINTSSLTLPSNANSTKTITTNNTPRSSPMQITGTQSVKNTTSPCSARPLATTNPSEKKPESVKASSPNSKDKKSSPERKITDKNQKKTPASHDKKKSPDNNSGKSGNASNVTAPTKKFRHILPRVTTTAQNIPTTTLSVSTPTRTSPVQKTSSKQSQQKISPTGGIKKQFKNSAVDDKKPTEILDLTGSSSNTPPPPVLPLPATVPSNPPQLPPGASDIAAFLNETILRAQQHSAANGNGIFLPHLAAAASFNPSFASINFGYNIQQAYLMEQFSRMQKAGHEALEKYMQKLKASNNGTRSGPNSPNESLNNTTSSSVINGGNGGSVTAASNSPTKSSEGK